MFSAKSRVSKYRMLTKTSGFCWRLFNIYRFSIYKILLSQLNVIIFPGRPHDLCSSSCFSFKKHCYEGKSLSSLVMTFLWNQYNSNSLPPDQHCLFCLPLIHKATDHVLIVNCQQTSHACNWFTCFYFCAITMSAADKLRSRSEYRTLWLKSRQLTFNFSFTWLDKWKHDQLRHHFRSLVIGHRSEGGMQQAGKVVSVFGLFSLRNAVKP